jgi:hypothetical protein
VPGIAGVGFAVAQVASRSTQASAHCAHSLLARGHFVGFAYRLKGQRARTRGSPALRLPRGCSGVQPSAHVGASIVRW